MKQSSIGPATKLRRGAELILNGKSVWVERDPKNGTIFICDDKSLKPSANFWWVNKKDLNVVYKSGSSISNKPKKLSEKESNDKKDLNSFFDSLGDKVSYNCQNCRKPMYAFTKPAKRASCAHILAKSRYPSIAKNPDNILFLGVDVFGASCYCHSTFDSTVEKRMKMPIYETALKRFELLKPFLNKKELIMAEEDLGIRTKSLKLVNDLKQAI